MSMKPFNLEEAKAGKPLVTRDGRKARFIAHVPECTASWRVVAHIFGSGTTNSFSEDGKLLSPSENSLDLFMATERREGWVNVYKDRSTSEAYHTKADAEKYAIHCIRVACVRIEWEE